MARTNYDMPWNDPALREWSICGMNHYRVNGVRHLFVSMTRANVAIVAEGLLDEEVFVDLIVQATALNIVIDARTCTDCGETVAADGAHVKEPGEVGTAYLCKDTR